VRGQRHAPAALYPWERPGTHCTGGWVGPRAGLDRCDKSRPHRDSIPGPSSPLYRLRYPAPHNKMCCFIKMKYQVHIPRPVLYMRKEDRWLSSETGSTRQTGLTSASSGSLSCVAWLLPARTVM